VVQEETDSLPVIEIENLGPIKKARFQLAPITVLIGPNNSGKSFLGTVIYALGRGIQSYTQSVSGGFLEEYSSRQRLAKLGEDDAAFRPILNTERKRLASLISRSFARIYGETAAELIRWGQTKLTVRLRLKNLTVTVIGSANEFRTNIRLRNTERAASEIRQTPGLGRLLRGLQETGKEVRLGTEQIAVRFDEYPFLEEREPRYSTSRWLLAGLDRSALNNPSYLLAERAGLIRIYRPLLSVYMRTSLPELLRRYGRRQPMEELIRELASPSLQLPILATDFLEDVLLGAPRRAVPKGRIPKVLQEMEKLMEGAVHVSENLDITYHQNGKGIDIVNASSMVAELVPIFQVLRRGVGRSLIVEEPEAHLHLRKQRDIARVFARLHNAKLSLFITTHSIAIPITLAHLAALSRISTGQRRKLHLDPEEAIPREALSLLFIKVDRQGNEVGSLNITSEGAIERIPYADELMEQLYYEEEKLSKLVP